MITSNLSQTMLPWIIQIGKRRKSHPHYFMLINSIQVIFCFLFFFTEIENYVDSNLSTLLIFIKSYTLQNYYLLSALTYATITEVLLLIFTLAYLKSTNQKNTWKSNENNKFIRRLCLLYLIFELILVPSFFLMLYNIKYQMYSALLYLNIISLPFLICLVIAEKGRRIFKQYLIPIGIFTLFFDQKYSSLMWCILSIHLARTQKSLLKIIYFQFMWFGLTPLIAIIAEVRPSFYHIGLISIQIVVVCVLIPREDQSSTYLQENDILLHCIEDRDFSKKSKRFDFKITKIINIFFSRLRTDHQNEIIMKKIMEKQESNNKQYLLKFLTFKINEERRIYDNIILEIQQIQCCLLSQSFSTKLVQQLLKLSMKMKQQNKFTHQIRVHNIIQKVEKQYLRNDGINASSLIQTQGQLSHFYHGILQIIKIIMEFWTLKQQNKLNVLKMKRQISSIILLETKLKIHLSKIQQFRPTNLQTQIYNYVMKLINNNSNEVSMPQSHVYSSIECLQSSNLNYILIQKQQIVDISHQMAIQIHKHKMDILGININSMFPSQLKHFVASYSDSLIQTCNKGGTIILPFLIGPSNVRMQPYKCRFQIFPHLINGIKFIIHFYNSEHLQTNPTFLFNPQQDKIFSVSSNFLSYFVYESDEISKVQILGSEIFNIDIGDICRQKQKVAESQDQWINCILNLRKISKTRKHFVHAQIKCLQKYCVESGTIFLLEIKKKQVYPSLSHKNMKNTVGKYFEKEKHKNVIQHKNISFIGVNFCKIANSYQNVIDQKMLRIKQLNKLSYLKMTLIVLSLNVLLLAIMLILLIVYINTSMDGVNKKYNNNNYNGNQIFNINQIMYKYLNYYQLTNYPISYESINTNINISALSTTFSMEIEQDLQHLLFNLFQTHKQNTAGLYNMSFSDYSIIASTQSTAFIDFLQNIKLALKNNDPSFLIENQNALRVFIGNIPLTNDNIISDFIVILTQFIIAETIIVFINFLILKFFLHKIRQINVRLLDLYTKIDQEQVAKVRQQLKQFGNVLQTSDKYNLQSQNSNDSLNKMEEQALSHRKIRKKTIMQAIKFDRTTKKIDQKSEADILNKLNQTKSQHSLNTNIIIKYSSNFVLDNITIVISLIILAFLLLIIKQANQFKGQFHTIFETSLNFHENINKIQSKAYQFYNSGMMQVLPPQRRKTWQIDQNQTLTTQIYESLPQVYRKFQSIKVQTLNQELCTFTNGVQTYYGEQFNCSEILGEVLTKGFESSIDLYFELINNFGQVSMQDYSTTYRVGAKYPVFFQISFLKEVLTDVLSQLQLQFNSITTAYIQQWRIFLILLPQLGTILIPIIIGVSYLHYLNIRQQCKFGLKIFVLIPRSYLIKMSTTKMLRNSKIMEDIQWLAS